MKRILFVCIENSNRSQMAEAFANIYGQGRVEAHSAGSNPSGKINEKAVEAMKELNYDLTKHSSKSTGQFRNMNFDYVITMGCGDQCPFIPAKITIDWDIPDPKNMNMDEFRKIRDMIGEKVNELLNKVDKTIIK